MSARRTALVTGASAGIGSAFANHLADEGFDIVLVARRKERLEALASEIESRTSSRCHVLPVDLSDPAAVSRIASDLEEHGIDIDVLVANAGYAITDGFRGAGWQDHADFIQVMATGVAELCHLLVPPMIERGWGRIINVSSLAAFAPEVEGSLYGAVKSFVVRLSEALALEVAGTGVHVTALCPGFTITEFHDVMGTRDHIDRLPGYLLMSAEDVVREGWRAVERGESVWINGRFNRMLVRVIALTPRAILQWVGRRRLMRPQTH